MPVEAILSLTVFGSLLVLWVLLPDRAGDDDFGAKLRRFLLGRRRD